jgi:hypothetical protein
MVAPALEADDHECQKRPFDAPDPAAPTLSVTLSNVPLKQVGMERS